MKISTVLFVKYWTFIVLVSVRVWGQEEELSCDRGSRPLACPEVLCNLISTRKFDSVCDDIPCEGLTSADCPSGTEFKHGLTMCGCCPGCAKYLALGERCEVAPPELDINCKEPICPIIMNECKPGLACNYLGEFSKTCSLVDQPSDSAKQEGCIFKRNQGLNKQIHWTPECDVDDPSKYAPKQCKGQRSDGTCFCVDPEGNRIFGREWWDKAENQTCDCSRRVFNLRKEGNIATIHCSSDGNYEPLQCDMDSGLCYCVDTVTGELNGAVLPEHQWKLLPCYSVVLNGDATGQYLRQCESEWGAGQRVRNEGLLHGVDVYAVGDFKCDYDGSFTAVRRDGLSLYCVPKTGSIFESQGHKIQVGQQYMDCQCFRDASVYSEEGRTFVRKCDTLTGNYEITSQYNQVANDYACVDKDGFFYGDPVPSLYSCCLTSSCTTSDLKEMCYDPVTKTGTYKSCWEYLSYEKELY